MLFRFSHQEEHMLPAATRLTGGTEDARPAPTLYLAFELGNRDWKLGFTTGFGQRRRAMQAYFTATRTPPFFFEKSRSWRSVAFSRCNRRTSSSALACRPLSGNTSRTAA